MLRWGTLENMRIIVAAGLRSVRRYLTMINDNSSTYMYVLFSMIKYRMVIVEGRCTELQLLISYIYNHWLTQKYSEFRLVRYIGLVWSNIAVTFLLPSYIYDHCIY